MFNDGAEVVLQAFHKLARDVAPAEVVIRGFGPDMGFILDIYGWQGRSHKPRRFAINLEAIVVSKNPANYLITELDAIADRWAADNHRINIEDADPRTESKWEGQEL